MVTIFAQQINLWSVLVGGILAMVLGFVWYHPKLFGDLWAKENNLNIADMNTTDPTPFVVMFVGALIMALTLQWFLKATAADTYLSTLRIVFSLWGAFTFVTTAGNYKFSKRSWTLILLDSGYFLVDMLIMGTVFFYWK